MSTTATATVTTGAASERAAGPDSQRFTRAIRYLVEHRESQPALADAARVAGLSPHYFDRRFKAWAGVTPKQFLQFLTLEHAKALLADARSVLETSFEVGLSGPGRLHDLFVSVDAVTPGEYKQHGEGVEIAWDEVPTPFGDALVAVTDRGVCWLSFHEAGGLDGAVETLEQAWSRAAVRRRPGCVAPVARRLRRQLGATLDHADGPLRLHLRGTNFQLQVWQALMAIPSGTAVSYGDLARSLGRPRGARAVANAVAANPVAVLIPCHRVIRSTGELAGYRWGRGRKRALLAWESARCHDGWDGEAAAGQGA